MNLARLVTLVAGMFFILNVATSQSRYFQKLRLNKEDSILASKIPKLTLPVFDKDKLNRELPYKLNNAELPFLRPIFNQDGASCGQAASVGYAFTYEINRLRGLDASYEENQYPSHFSWNFMNGGSGFRGVSYFHTYEILEKCGTPNVETYGGMSAGGDSRWMSGFERYFSAMHNRVKNIYSIDVSDSVGILTLKHWLNDHLDGSEYGGVANFYAASPYAERIIKDGTPEAGKHIMIQWGPIATHAMTIVGYNDSIRYDINSDGKYTNDIDINSDGVVDMKDWEYGAFLFANSYDSTWDDKGYCYMSYRTMALEYGQGGIWNNTVNVLNVYENYEPQLTMRLRLKYNSRENIKLQVGINPDESKNIPAYTMDYPIIDFQGGSQPMQGYWDTDTCDIEIIEIELDVSKLLSYVDFEKPAKFFLEVVENDDSYYGNGEIQYFSLVERTEGVKEIICDDVPKTITNNWKTTLSVVSNPSFEKPEIITEELPILNQGQSYNTNLLANGGHPPYTWSLVRNYIVKPLNNDFPEIGGELITFDNLDEANKTFALPFQFPFYGDSLNEITVVLDGYVAFGEKDLSYPYFIGESTMLQTRKVIAPFMSDLWIAPMLSPVNGVWVDSNTDYFAVLWNTSYDYHGQVFKNNYKFALIIYPDGRIETFYDIFDLPPYFMWASGVSNGDDVNYSLNPYIDNQQDPSEKAFVYESNYLPSEIEVSELGELTASDLPDDVIYNITAIVEDAFDIKDEKTFQLSSGLIYNYIISSGDDDRIDFSETTSLQITVKNVSDSNFQNISGTFSINDDYFTILKNEFNIDKLAPGELKVLDSVFVFKVSSSILDNYIFNVNADILADTKEWHSKFHLRANAPYFLVIDNEIVDDNNAKFDTGETVGLKYVIQNIGNVDLENINISYLPNSEYVTPLNSVQNIDIIKAGGSVELLFYVKSDNLTPFGLLVPAELKISRSDEIIQQLSVPVNVGRSPVLLLSLADDSSSVLKFKENFDSLKISYNQIDYCPSDMSGYQSVFVCLGGLYQNYQLSSFDAAQLNNYLNEGGNIYMEGMHTWINDEQFTLHQKFDAKCNSTSNYFQLKTFRGIPGTYTDGLELESNDELNFINYYLSPEEGAFPFLNYLTGDTSCVIANETSNYKTIASPVIYGSMEDANDEENLKKYVEAIVSFFDLDIQYLNIDEISADINPFEVEIFPNPSKGNFTISMNLVKQNTEVKIYNIGGNLVAQKNISDFDSNGRCYLRTTDNISNILSPGLYIVSIKSGKYSSYHKLVVL